MCRMMAKSSFLSDFIFLPYFSKILQVSHLQDFVYKNNLKMPILAAI